MKCLSIKQPFANLIAKGLKTYEIRHRYTKYRGEILICSSKQPINRNFDKLPLGKTICIATLYDVEQMTKEHCKDSFCPFLENHWAWCLTNIREIKQLDIKGQLGLFSLPIYLKEAVILL